jgi:maleylpyruvate isomerase
MSKQAAAGDEDVELAIEGSREATGRLFDTLEQIDDSVGVHPSRLPGWSVGHVLTHLARNADSFVRILTAAAEGREVRQYATGDAGRNQDIEEGAKRPAAEIIGDLRAAAVRLDATWAEMPDVVWQRRGLRNNGAPLPCWLLPVSRWREVEVHHVDLGLGYSVSDWPAEFVSLDLPLALDRVPERIEDPAQRADFLAWIYGRAGEPTGLVLRPF